MFIEDFEVFIQEAEDLYRSRPLQTRYCIKYRHCDGKLVLKVTDDVKVGMGIMRYSQANSLCTCIAFGMPMRIMAPHACRLCLTYHAHAPHAVPPV